MSDPLSLTPHIDVLFERLRGRADGALIATVDGEVSCLTILTKTNGLIDGLKAKGIGQGSICAFKGDYSKETIPVFLALARLGAIAVPFTAALDSEQENLARTANVEWWIEPRDGSARKIEHTKEPHVLVKGLNELRHPGLIVFTSGSTGKPKAILHDVEKVAGKFMEERKGWRLVLFLLMDHFGGFNTLMSVLANGSVGICARDRSPKSICESIQSCKAEVLPTTPTFLGMLIASGLYKEYDLSSLKLVTYGAEPMPPSTLEKIRNILPQCDFKQTYGLSELGVLRSSSPDGKSLWLSVGGKGFETKIVDGQLHIRSNSAMVGYLNAESPIDAEGWMNTGDLVEEKDGLIRFLGRRSEVINVGGQKVQPTEVEDVLLEAEGIAAAVVHGIPHVILGQAVVARVALTASEDLKALTDRLRLHCRSRLQKYKVPMRFEITEYESLATARAKKNRFEPEGRMS